MQQQPVAALRSMVGGLWMIDSNLKSSIYIRSSIETSPLSVTPILYLSNGKQYQLPNVQIEAEGTAVVNVNDALQSLGISAYAPLSGYVEIQYTWAYDPICVTVNSVDTLHSLIFVSSLRPLTAPLIPPTNAALPSFISDGMWWKQEKDVTGFVALSNVTGASMTASLRVTDEQNNPLASHQVSLAAHATKVIDLPELQSALSSAGGLEVEHDGAEGGLTVTGEMQDPAAGYSASMPFSLGRPTWTSASTLTSYAELGLMTGAADPMMSFPNGTVFTPFTVARNVSGQAVTITPTVYWMQDGAAKGAPSTAFQLNPNETRVLDMTSILAAANLKSYNGSANLVLDVQGKPHSVLLAAGSVDQTDTYVFQIVPRAVGVSASRTLSYWSTGNGDDTMVSVWNPADEDQDFIFTFNYTGGHYDYPIHLGPRATQFFNVSELIRDQIPDDNGNRIPADIHEGSAKIHGTQGEVQEILVALDTGTYNVRKATCSYFCIWCDGYYTAQLIGAPFGVGVGRQYGLTLSGNWDGNTSYNVTSSATWSSSATNVAKVATGTVTGVALGSASISAYAELPYYYQYCAYDPTSCPSDFVNMGGSGSATVANLSCTSAVPRGNTATCTVTPSGITVSGWKFVDSSGNVVTRSSNTGSLTWSGIMATTGVVSVTIGSTVMSAAIAVIPRPGFTFTAVSPTNESNGFSGDNCTLSVPSPPASGKPLGFSCLFETASWSTGWIGDGGMNNLYSFVTTASMNNVGGTTGYFYTISPDLQNSSSAFYVAQCGNYNAQSKPTGFISGANLLTNTNRHEAGPVQSHYNNYVQAQNNAANNVGTLIEMQVYLGSNVTLSSNIGPLVNQAISRITTSMEVEPCEPNYNATCVFQGNVNYLPYQSCD